VRKIGIFSNSKEVVIILPQLLGKMQEKNESSEGSLEQNHWLF
jgi:hypothetical protein